MSLEHVEHSVCAGLRNRGNLTQSILLSALLAGACCPAFGVDAVRPEPATPRELYNEGTARLRDGKLREAEALLQVAVASNNEKIQTPALYNLGHTRFRQGM